MLAFALLALAVLHCVIRGQRWYWGYWSNDTKGGCRIRSNPVTTNYLSANTRSLSAITRSLFLAYHSIFPSYDSISLRRSAIYYPTTEDDKALDDTNCSQFGLRMTIIFPCQIEMVCRRRVSQATACGKGFTFTGGQGWNFGQMGPRFTFQGWRLRVTKDVILWRVVTFTVDKRVLCFFMVGPGYGIGVILDASICTGSRSRVTLSAVSVVTICFRAGQLYYNYMATWFHNGIIFYVAPTKLPKEFSSLTKATVLY